MGVVYQYLPPEVGLLQPVLNLLTDWCRVLSDFPVVTWPRFVEYVRSRVNLLATEEHIRELVNQLVVIGEVTVVLLFDDDDDDDDDDDNDNDDDNDDDDDSDDVCVSIRPSVRVYSVHRCLSVFTGSIPCRLLTSLFFS